MSVITVDELDVLLDVYGLIMCMISIYEFNALRDICMFKVFADWWSMDRLAPV